jgi:CTP synthase
MEDSFDFQTISTQTDDSENVDYFPPSYRIGRTKYIVITGGVMSGVGKGVFSASLAHLLGHYGFSASQMKIDGYLNYDAGTLNPYRHGEVFVLEDGTECDMDLGTYERFLDENLTRDNYLTSGKLYTHVLEKERRGKYLGRDVLVIPHVTGEIKNFIRTLAIRKPYDIVLIEIGGTVGDIENLHFIEAARELYVAEGRENVMFCHVTMVPYNEASGEQKSKPTQHSVKKLLEIGIQPDIIVGRCPVGIHPKVRQKISLFCNVPQDNVISSPDVSSIYVLPHLLDRQKLADTVTERLKLSMPMRRDPSGKRRPLARYVEHYRAEELPVLTVAITGKYATLKDSYVSIVNSLEHCEVALGCRVEVAWIETTEINTDADLERMLPENLGAVIVPGGFGARGVEGKIRVIRHCRENGVPFLGICYGFHFAVVEFARHALGLEDAHTTEVDAQTPHPVIDLLPEQRKKRKLGGTMRLGGHTVKLRPESRAAELYNGAAEVVERFRHRFEFNNDYREAFEEAGMRFSGTTPDGGIMQVLELSGHPYFMASQFHPEYTSRPLAPNPLFLGLMKAGLDRRRGKA